MHPKISNHLSQHLEVWSIPFLVKRMMHLFALSVEFDCGEMAMHASKRICAQPLLNFFSHSTEILNFLEPAKLSGMQMSPIQHELGVFDLLVDGEDFFEAAYLEFSSHAFRSQLTFKPRLRISALTSLSASRQVLKAYSLSKSP